MAPTCLKAGLVLLSQLHLTRAMILAPRQQVTYSFATAANSGDTCDSFAAEWGLTEQTFESLNPGVSCPNLVVVEHELFVFGSAGQDLVHSRHLHARVDHVVINDFKTSRSRRVPPPIVTIFTWFNPATRCTNIIAGFYCCVGVPGASKVTTTTTTSTKTTGNGISTPTPIQTGMTTSCNKFYLVQSGDSCAVIATTYNVPLATFCSWNPAVGSSCATLDVGYYVCVDAIDYTPPKTTTTTTKKTSTTSSGGQRHYHANAL
ncbi:hypothetical protein ACHAPX_010071 [Trichoderma viride]